MSLSLIIFDCDGVILESVDAKTQAFARIGACFGQEAADRLVQYHIVHGGVSRVEKFAWLFTEVLGKTITAQEQEDLGRLFAEYTLQAVTTSALVPGMQAVLDAWKGRVPMYVASGAPHEELNSILQARGLHPYFAGVYGSPPGKTELLRRILRESACSPYESIMIGDSSTDMYAAEAVHTRFYGRGPYFANSGYPWHTDLTLLNEHLEALYAEA